MKTRIYIYTILILFVSCNNSNKKESENTEIVQFESNVNRQYFNLEQKSDLTFSEWVDYYQSLEPNFSLDNFEFKSKDTLIVIEGNVIGNFDSIYTDFLIYRNHKDKYVDFDSYSWSTDEKNELLFSPDQEINVVDIKNKTVERMAFRGPSQWAENIF